MGKQKNPYVKQLERLLEKHQTVEGEQPLECLVSIYQNKKNTLGLRLQAAIAAAVYVHKKMPVAVEVDQTIHMEYQPAPTYDVPLPPDIAKRLTGEN